jgi:hypothetical protein
MQRPRRKSRALPRRVHPSLEVLEGRIAPATLTVTNNSDSGAAGSLRGEIAAAAPGDTIVFAPGLSGTTITLNSANGPLSITKSLTIQGLGANQLAVSGGNATQVFNIAASTTVSISGLSIENGLAQGANASVGPDVPATVGQGGGIFNRGVLTLTNDVVTGNQAQGGNGNTGTTASNKFGADGQGGGLFNSAGTVTLTNDVFSHNTAQGGQGVGSRGGGFGDGGAVYSTGGSLAITGGSSTNNVARGGLGGNGSAVASGGTGGNGEGGGLFASGSSLSISAATFITNTAQGGAGGVSGGSGGNGIGGGLFLQTASPVTITLSGNTIAGNQAVGGAGGAGFSPATGNINGSDGGPGEFADGGGLFASTSAGALTLNLVNDTVANNLVVGGAGGNGGNAHHTGAGGNTGGNGGAGGTANGGGLTVLAATLTLTNDTIAGNKAFDSPGGAPGSNAGTTTAVPTSGAAGLGFGGGINEGGATVNVQNTIVATNSAAFTDPDLLGIYVSNGNNFIGDATGSTGFTNGVNFDQVGPIGGKPLNPLLGVLQNNGGLVPTMALLPGSTAIDAGKNGALGITGPFDARGTGFNRQINGTIDIGAYEFQPPLTTTTLLASASSVPSGPPVLLVATVVGKAPGSNTVQGSVTFFDGSTPLGTVALTGGVASLTVTLPVGANGVTAVYNGFAQGDYTFATSTSNPVTVTVTPPAPPSVLPQVFAFLIPAPSGQVGITGFVFDPDNLLEPHTVVIDWHDGTAPTTLVLPVTANLFGGGTYTFFPNQTHKKHRHRTITVFVVDPQVVAELAAGGGILPHFDVSI